MKSLLLLTTILVSTSPIVTHAHDYWMQPNRFAVAAGSPVTIRLFVGDAFNSEVERPFQQKMTLRFDLASGDNARDLTKLATDGRKPLLKLKSLSAGTHWLVMERDVSHITLKPAKFTKYLKHEGLDRIIKARRDAGEDKKPGRERYSRYLKCLLQSGDKRDATWKRVFKLRLEIVPMSNPANLKAGETLKVRVLFEGRPLTAAPLFCHRTAGDKVQTQATKTDKNGVALIKIPRKGSYLVRLVHMRRCKNSKRADWESFWGAMSFGVP